MDTKARFAFSKGDSAMVTEAKWLQSLSQPAFCKSTRSTNKGPVKCKTSL